ncbi:hypothetical protein [Limosilactobacillus reuteri]|uniref:hypothetical protein n=1 Tax=Limosilactobacillus reuteri TaxID=1598 RepID=UPI001E2B959F|nr:hypothetical protein [Limosilactobacillus reuteri]MCC4331821.1 hypothetical protein [Limosilactobacillus reuteri]MCC4354257.1 hypothetical protein [Limosilactobacillus reuteri]
MGETSILKYLEKTSPQALIDVLNSDLEQTANQYNSFCRLINDRLSIQNNLQFSHEPIIPSFNRQTRLQLMTNIRNLDRAFANLARLLNHSPFKKLDKGLIVPYDFHAYIDIGIKLTKDEINSYIKQVENVLKELFDFKAKYRLND